MRSSKRRHCTLYDVIVTANYLLKQLRQRFVDVTAKFISSLVKYEKSHISLVKYFTLDDMKTILLKTNGDFKLGM